MCGGFRGKAVPKRFQSLFSPCCFKSFRHAALCASVKPLKLVCCNCRLSSRNVIKSRSKKVEVERAKTSPASGFACADPVSSMCAVEQCQPDYRRDVSKPAVAHLVIVHSARAAAGVERAAAVTLARSAPALVHPHALRGLGEGVEHAIVRVAVTIVSWVFGQCAGSTLRTLCWRRNHAVRERQTTCEPHF